MGKKIKGIWRNISLVKKLNFVVIVTVCFISFSSLVVLRYLNAFYLDEIYRKNAIALNCITSNLETELQTVSTMTDYLLTDETMQENFLIINNRFAASSEKMRARRLIYESLYAYMDASKAISSISLVSDNQVIQMGDTSNWDLLDTKEIEKQAAYGNGNRLWTQELSNTGHLYCVRQIRQEKYLKLNTLAVLYVEIDMEYLLRHLLAEQNISQKDVTVLFCAADGRLLYPGNSPYYPYVKEIDFNTKSFSLKNINQKKYFITSGVLSMTNWTYINLSDYDYLFSNVSKTIILCMVAFIIATLVAMGLIYFVIRNTIQHFHILEKKMEYFSQGNLDFLPCRYTYTGRKDEIGLLHQQFDQTIVNFRKLINDNYIKQITLKDAKIKMLVQQINPHFLYNTLDSINWMAQTYHIQEISEMSRCLANLFRAVISDNSECVPLFNELDFLHNYIKIQKIRFGERLEYEEQAPGDCLSIMIPKLSIQPLIENAIKYSVECTDETCNIRLQAACEDDFLTICVSNTGSIFEETLQERVQNHAIDSQERGIGLSNIDLRLKLIYGDEYGLRFTNRENHAIVFFRIPKKADKL